MKARASKSFRRAPALRFRGTTPPKNTIEMLKRALATVPELHRRHIEVEPFVYVHDGIEFGLIPQAPEDEGGSWTVNAMPGDYMCLLPPWDGTYDT